ncbi:hypothetical protein SLA2020_395050 [Shorea laevis]
MKQITTLLIVLSALLMIWVAALQANAAMTDRRLLSDQANLGRQADVGAATDANNAATVVTSSTDGAAADDTNPDPGKYSSSGSDTNTHHKYPDDKNPNKP